MMASAYQEFLTNRKLPSELFKIPGQTPSTFLHEFDSRPLHTMGKLSPPPQQCADSYRNTESASPKYGPLASQNLSASKKYVLSASQKHDLSASQKYDLSASQKYDLSASQKYDLSVSPQCDQSASQRYDSMTLCPRDAGTLKDFTASKPDLKFSIERILGLTPSRGTYEGLHFLGDVADEQEEDCDEEDSVDVEETSRVDDFNSDNGDDDLKKPCDEDDEMKYQWLQCTRYHPPKLQRNKKKDAPKKRKLGRNPRVPFTQHQVLVLEEKFRRTHYLSSMDVAELSGALNLTETRVKIWFQNRRARERRDKGGGQYQQAPLAQKPFQPLTIPSVSWSVSPSNYMQYPQVLDFRSGYMTQAFNVYNTRGTGELPTNISNDKLTSQ